MALEDKTPTKDGGLKSCQHRCPCSENKCHLGVSDIVTKQPDTTPELQKVQKKFFLGHGIKTDDPVEASKIFIQRDHDKLEALQFQYCHGKLGVYMVPPMFFGEVPEAIDLSKYKDPKHLDRVQGDIAERTMYHGLKKHYELIGDDVLIIHSHKFLNNSSNNEKDFIVLNLSKGK